MLSQIPNAQSELSQTNQCLSSLSGINVMCAADARCLLASPFVVHMGTNQKAQQSCGAVLVEE